MTTPFHNQEQWLNWGIIEPQRTETEPTAGREKPQRAQRKPQQADRSSWNSTRASVPRERRKRATGHEDNGNDDDDDDQPTDKRQRRIHKRTYTKTKEIHQITKQQDWASSIPTPAAYRIARSETATSHKGQACNRGLLNPPHPTRGSRFEGVIGTRRNTPQNRHRSSGFLQRQAVVGGGVTYMKRGYREKSINTPANQPQPPPHDLVVVVPLSS
ncbi:MAG: hypothetical protein M1830_003322 [Pleopsidium flavum]|nr:MAG: hypothetical protein M1830_003322 [Pleopsidium flavum]